MTRISLALPLTLVALATGCVDSESDLGADTAGITVRNGDNDPCPLLGCGSNSAHVGPNGFHELNTDGIPNLESLKIVSFRKDYGQPGAPQYLYYQPVVQGTTLFGKHTWLPTLSGSNLVGAEFEIEGPPDANGAPTRFLMKIKRASTTQWFWQPPSGLLNTYELVWSYPGVNTAGDRPVCNNPPNRREGEMALLKSTVEAVLFTGDRYNSDDITVTATTPETTRGWFNIGCSGSVLMKLALNRHTSATQASANPTTKSQRQAMLKMYTSDVCGAGDALTVQGTPLRWWSTGPAAWASPPIAYNSNEARWTEDGAQCLDVHRLNNSPDDMTSQIQKSCDSVGRELPLPCSSRPASYDFRTASPALP